MSKLSTQISNLILAGDVQAARELALEVMSWDVSEVREVCQACDEATKKYSLRFSLNGLSILGLLK